MPERTIDTELWDSDEWFQNLDIMPRYLFWYLGWNNHVKPSGLYYITPTTISLESKIPKDDLSDLLKALEEKVVWYADDNLIWVKNFYKRQYKSPDFGKAAAKSLLTIRNYQTVQNLLNYNKERYPVEFHHLFESYLRYKDKKALRGEKDNDPLKVGQGHDYPVEK